MRNSACLAIGGLLELTCRIPDNYKKLIGPGCRVEVVTEQLADGELQVSVVQTIEHNGEWCRRVLASENGASWDRIIRLVYQHSILASSCQGLDYDGDGAPFFFPRQEQQEQIVVEEEDFESLSCNDEESSGSELGFDEDDISSYAESEMVETAGQQPAFHYPMPAVDEHFEYICRPPPPPRPQPPPPPPPPMASPPPPPPSEPSAASERTSRPGRRQSRQTERAVTTEAQITIDWAGHGTLHVLERVPLNRASIVGKALGIIRSGQFEFAGGGCASSTDLERPCPSPSRLHATLRKVEMGDHSVHVTGRIETFESLYAAAVKREPGVLPVFVVHVRSDE